MALTRILAAGFGPGPALPVAPTRATPPGQTLGAPLDPPLATPLATRPAPPSAKVLGRVWGKVSASVAARLKAALTAAAAAVLAAGCDPAPNAPAPGAVPIGQAAPTLRLLVDEFGSEIIRSSPELATSYGAGEAMFAGVYADRLDDRSAAAMEALNRATGERLARLQTFDRTRLVGADAIAYDTVAAALDNMAAAGGFGYGQRTPTGWFAPYVINQLDSAFLTLPDFLDTQHSIATLEDAEHYLARLSQVAGAIDAERERMIADAGKGVIPPAFVLTRARDLARGVVRTMVGQSVYVTALGRKLAAARAIDPGIAADRVARARGIVTADIYPAYDRLITAIDDLRPRAPVEPGVWRQPNGDAYYAAALKMHTTTSLTADEIHALGLQKVAELTAALDAALTRQGVVGGSVGERLQRLSADPRSVYPNTEAGRSRLLADLNVRVRAMENALPTAFSRLPKASVEVRRVPSMLEAAQPGGYYQPPSADARRPGAYYINLRDTREWPKFSLPTLTYHESVPGHHLQGALALEDANLPVLRKLIWFAAYGEGWALYAEQLADELGAYRTDPMGRIGYLQSMLFRAARLVVDTGIHSKRWSREQASDYMVRVTGQSVESITTEVERYAVWPGQATAYAVGWVEINRLRDKAKVALGARFDLRGFHDAVLANGAVPLPVLERVIDEWIALRRA